MKIAARSSALSRAQVQEVANALPHLRFTSYFVETKGDLDQKTSLRSLNKCDFFTKEVDRLVLEKTVRVAIHSAKDLPEPLPKGLVVAAITEGVDSRDCLVLRKDDLFEELPSGSLIATSSQHREEAVRSLRSDFRFCDVRGTIEKRLERLTRQEVDGVVLAEAAIVRLGLCSQLNRFFLPGSTTEHQGRLAIVVRKEDREAKELFSLLDSRGKKRPWTILHLGLDPSACPSKGCVLHYPVVRPKRIDEQFDRLIRAWKDATHLLFTSKTAVHFLPELSWKGKTVLVVGEKTAAVVRKKGVEPIIAPFAEQEGVIELFKTLDLRNVSLLWPRSSRARPILSEFFKKEQIDAQEVELYEPVFHRPGVPPALEEIDEIVFMSPTCVEGFRKIYPRGLLQQKKFTFQGRITSQSCEKAALQDMLTIKTI